MAGTLDWRIEPPLADECLLGRFRTARGVCLSLWPIRAKTEVFPANCRLPEHLASPSTKGISEYQSFQTVPTQFLTLISSRM